MKKKKPTYHSIDEYIALFPLPTQKKLQQIRKIIQKLAPDAKEKISYQIPTFYLQGNLVHFAGYEKHIGFYPGAAGVAFVEEEIVGKYTYAKGSIQFPLTKPLPVSLIKKIVQFRVAQNRANKKNTP